MRVSALISTLPGSAMHRLCVEVFQRHHDAGAGMCAQCGDSVPCPARRHGASVIVAAGEDPRWYDPQASTGPVGIAEVSAPPEAYPPNHPGPPTDARYVQGFAVGVMVAVIGPPGAGKSTVVRALADAEGAAVFRLREAVRAFADVIGAAAPTGDPLGWIDRESVRRVLGQAFVAGRFPTGDSLVLLDNFPGTAAQLDLLIEVAGACGRRVGLLELQADSAVVTARTALRRVCPGCGPDMHHPAGVAATEPQRCAGCGASLLRRDSDTPALHGLRLGRYRDNAPGILARARRRHIPHASIDAGLAPELVHNDARHAVHRLCHAALPSN